METVENVFELAHSIPQGVVGEKMSSFLHESPEDTRRGFETALPASIAGIAQRASTNEGAQALLNAFKQGNYPHIEVEDLSRTIADPVAGRERRSTRVATSQAATPVTASATYASASPPPTSTSTCRRATLKKVTSGKTK